MSTKNKTQLDKVISDRCNSISPSGIRKFFDLLANMEGVISFMEKREPKFIGE